MGTVVSTAPALHIDDDALMPGCNAGVDLAAGLYYKTGAVELTLVPASGCTNCTGADTSCCRDPTAWC